MTVIYNLDQIRKPLKNPVITIGNFDGVHKGHLTLFEKVKERARAINGKSAVMTFDPHPIKVVMTQNIPPLITPTRQKIELIQASGIDFIIFIPFTKEFADISAKDFIKSILVDKIGIREVVVGYDYTFGYNREGNIELLQDMGRQFVYGVHVMPPFRIANGLVSSTSVRNLIQEGKISEAKKLLGRDYQIYGTVVKGKDRGAKLLGFPTANLKLADELIPKPGVYAVTVLIEDQTYKGVTNIGFNPTFGNGHFSVETHVIDFSGDLQGKSIKVNFMERLRDEKTFKSPRDLAEQIRKDIRKTKEFFRNAP